MRPTEPFRREHEELLAHHIGLAARRTALRPVRADRVHFRKEEDIQLPAFDAAPPEVTQRVLEGMEALAGDTHEH